MLGARPGSLYSPIHSCWPPALFTYPDLTTYLSSGLNLVINPVKTGYPIYRVLIAAVCTMGKTQSKLPEIHSPLQTSVHPSLWIYSKRT